MRVKTLWLYVFLVAVICGMFFDRFIGDDLNLNVSIIVSIFLGLFFIIEFFQKSDLKILLIFFICGFVLISLRINFLRSDPILPKFENQQISLDGKIIKEPDIRETTARFVILIDQIVVGKRTYFPTREKVILITDKYEPLDYGDEISVFGKIDLPENFQNDNEIEFDYVNFLAKDKIYALIYRPKISKIPNDKEGFLQKVISIIFLLKQKFLLNLQKILPSPQAELAGGILLGAKRALGTDLEDKFRIVGLIHVVVLSGYNMTIIAEAVFRLLVFLPKKISTTISILFIVLFVIMVGSGATVVRAGIMTILGLIARIYGHTYQINRALFLSALLMVFHNPDILFYDPSFSLSFMATYGLVNWSEKIEKLIWFLPNKFEIKQIVSATISTQIAVLPLLIKMTGEVSIVSLPVNLIVLPTMPLSMLFSFIAGLWLFFNFNLGVIVSIPANFLLLYVIKVVEIFSEFYFATVRLPYLDSLILFITYSSIVIIFNYGPVQIGKKIINVLSFTARPIITNIRMFPHIKSNDRRKTG